MGVLEAPGCLEGFAMLVDGGYVLRVDIKMTSYDDVCELIAKAETFEHAAQTVVQIRDKACRRLFDDEAGCFVVMSGW